MQACMMFSALMTPREGIVIVSGPPVAALSVESALRQTASALQGSYTHTQTHFFLL